MKTPEGTIDLIGTGMQIGLGVIDLVKTFAKTPDERAANKKRRDIRVAIRRLRHKFRDEPVSTYVKVNFSQYSTIEKGDIADEIRAVIGRN